MKRPIEDAYQTTLNGVFKQLYLTVTIVSILALIVLAIYKKNKIEADAAEV